MKKNLMKSYDYFFYNKVKLTKILKMLSIRNLTKITKPYFLVLVKRLSHFFIEKNDDSEEYFFVVFF